MDSGRWHGLSKSCLPNIQIYANHVIVCLHYKRWLLYYIVMYIYYMVYTLYIVILYGMYIRISARLSTAQSHESPAWNLAARFPICQKVDIWMIGCILYTLMFYRPAVQGCRWQTGRGFWQATHGTTMDHSHLPYQIFWYILIVFQLTNWQKHLDVGLCIQPIRPFVA